MGIVLDTLTEAIPLISDGGFGTSLQSAGLESGHCPEEWNVSRPDAVRAVHRGFVDAGSEMILTNTFGGSRPKLQRAGLADRTVELNTAAVRLALEAAGDRAIVVGSVGPTGAFLAPLGDYSPERMEEVYAEQIAALIAAGAAGICVETQSSTEEAACAIRAAKGIDPAVDVIATFTFEEGAGGFRTMMGVDPAAAAQNAAAAGADITGSNCGNGIERMADIVSAFKQHTHLPILVHANAGVPELVDGATVFRQTPEDFAAGAPAVAAAGAAIIGGCCGTGPDHIRALRTAIKG